MDDDKLMTESEAGAFLNGVPARTLQAWRARRVGPRYVKVGQRVRYRKSDLLAWCDARVTETAV